MPRIVLTTPIFPPDIGGPATYVPQMARALAADGWDVSVFTLSNDGAADDSALPYRVVREPRDVSPFMRRLRSVRKIVGLAREADIIYANGIVLESAIAARIVGKPMLQRCGGDVVWEGAYRSGQTAATLDEFMRLRQSWKLECKKAVRNWWLRQGHAVIVPSQNLARLLTAYCTVAPSRIWLIYSGVTVPADTPFQGQCRSADIPSVFRVVTSSRLISLKHADGIIRACASLPKTRLTVIGDGPERAKLEALAAELSLPVRFVGQLPRDEALSLMRDHDVFVLNSSYEGLPHVVIEAMALGLPVIGTAVGGTPEVVRDGENGLLIPCRDDAALRAALQRMRDDGDQRAAFSRAALETASRFTDSAMIEQTKAMLEEFLGLAECTPSAPFG